MRYFTFRYLEKFKRKFFHTFVSLWFENWKWCLGMWIMSRCSGLPFLPSEAIVFFVEAFLKEKFKNELEITKFKLFHQSMFTVSLSTESWSCSSYHGENICLSHIRVPHFLTFFPAPFHVGYLFLFESTWPYPTDLSLQ